MSHELGASPFAVAIVENVGVSVPTTEPFPLTQYIKSLLTDSGLLLDGAEYVFCWVAPEVKAIEMVASELIEAQTLFELCVAAYLSSVP